MESGRNKELDRENLTKPTSYSFTRQLQILESFRVLFLCLAYFSSISTTCLSSYLLQSDSSPITPLFISLIKQKQTRKHYRKTQKIRNLEENWKMEFHPDKCTVFTLSKNGNQLCIDFSLHNHTIAHETSIQYVNCTISRESI